MKKTVKKKLNKITNPKIKTILGEDGG